MNKHLTICAILFFGANAMAVEESDLKSLNLSKEESDRLSDQNIWSYFSAGLLFNYYPKDIIADAEIRDGVVRVKKKTNTSVNVGLQAFLPLYAWTYVRSYDGKARGDATKKWEPYSNHAFGAYVGASLAGESLIDNYSLGLAYSLQRKAMSFRIGFGAVFDPDAQYLSSEYQEGEPAPAGATNVQYIEKTGVGMQVMIGVSAGF